MKQVIFDYTSDDLSSATVDYWHVDEGDAVEEGDDLVELRTEEGELFVVPAPTGGILRERFFEPGDQVEIGDVIATIDDGLKELDEKEDEEEGLKGKEDEEDQEIDDAEGPFQEDEDL